jgi:hypothetical protein
MNNEKGFVHISLLVVLSFVYLLLFYWGSSGWGYMGYRGYHYGPSWWYWGGPRYHYGGNVKHGSVKGRSHRGGGFRGGK